MELIQKRIRRGGTVQIPAALMEQTGLVEGDAVNLRVENRQIIIEPTNAQALRTVLHQAIERMPVDVMADLLDFVEFSTTKQPDEEAFLWQNVEAAHEYERLHPDEIITVTDEE
ncbi:MAG: hypothetical protein U0350_08435 [Caldilineaceae bacterium]